jgi:hypothetical protein
MRNEHAGNLNPRDRALPLTPGSEHLERGHEEPRLVFRHRTAKGIHDSAPPRNLSQGFKIVNRGYLQTQWNRGVVSEGGNFRVQETHFFELLRNQKNPVAFRSPINQVVLANCAELLMLSSCSGRVLLEHPRSRVV